MRPGGLPAFRKALTLTRLLLAYTSYRFEVGIAMVELNVAAARFNMIEQQVRPWDVLEPAVLEVLAAVPREAFVPEGYGALAFADLELPLGHGEAMMAPKLEGRLLQALAPRPGDTVLEIGTGSGFLTACLARLARQVHSVELYGDLLAAARERLAAQGVGNVTLEEGDGARGWERHGPYDVIAVTGSLPLLADELRRQLKVGGRLFAVVGEGPAMAATLITRVAPEGWSAETLFETALKPLANAPRAAAFRF